MCKNWKKIEIYAIAGEKVQLWCKKDIHLETLLMSGVHIEEPAGNFVLEKFLKEDSSLVEQSQNFGIIPFRNPFYAFDKDKTKLQLLISNDEIDVELDPNAQLIYVNLRKNTEDFDARNFWKLLKENLCKQSLISTGNLYYILIPNTKKKEKKSYNAFLFTRGEIFDLNTGFGTIKAPHLDGLLQIIKENDSRLILDLHEGLGKGFYIYINPKKNFSLELGQHLISHMQKLGHKIKNDSSYRRMIKKGIFDLSCINKKGSLDSQIKQEQTLMIFETGIDQSIEQRIQAHVDAVNFTMSYLKIKKNG